MCINSKSADENIRIRVQLEEIIWADMGTQLESMGSTSDGNQNLLVKCPVETDQKNRKNLFGISQSSANRGCEAWRRCAVWDNLFGISQSAVKRSCTAWRQRDVRENLVVVSQSDENRGQKALRSWDSREILFKSSNQSHTELKRCDNRENMFAVYQSVENRGHKVMRNWDIQKKLLGISPSSENQSLIELKRSDVRELSRWDADVQKLNAISVRFESQQKNQKVRLGISTDFISQVFTSENRITICFPVKEKIRSARGLQVQEQQFQTRDEVIVFLECLFGQMHGKIVKTIQKVTTQMRNDRLGKMDWLQYVIKTVGKLKLRCEMILICGWLDLSAVRSFQKQEEKNLVIEIIAFWAAVLGEDLARDVLKELSLERIWYYFEHAIDSKWVSHEFVEGQTFVRMGGYISNPYLLECDGAYYAAMLKKNFGIWPLMIAVNIVIFIPCYLSTKRSEIGRHKCYYRQKQEAVTFLENMFQKFWKLLDMLGQFIWGQKQSLEGKISLPELIKIAGEVRRGWEAMNVDGNVEIIELSTILKHREKQLGRAILHLWCCMRGDKLRKKFIQEASSATLWSYFEQSTSAIWTDDGFEGYAEQ